MTREYFGRPEFWLDYCESDEDAESVAKLFDDFWLEYYATASGKEPGRMSSSDAGKEAFAWAVANLTQVEKALPFEGPIHPFRVLHESNVLQLDSDSEPNFWVYLIRAREAAREYLRQANPKPCRVRPRTSDGYRVVSGGRLYSQQSIASRMHQSGTHGGLRWGPLVLPYDQSKRSNYCVVGMPRSGKTTLLRLLLQSIDWRFSERRLVIYDEKTGASSAVFCDDKDFKRWGLLLNPFDQRGVAWDIARDADSPHEANEIARTLIPSTRSENPFYVAAPRAILAAAMVSLTAARGQAWNLMDLLLAVSPSNLSDWLKKSSLGQETFNTYFTGNSPSESDLKKTISAALNPLLPVAASWDRCRERVSIRDWSINGKGVLILGNLNAYAEAMRAINRTLLGILMETLLDRDRFEVKDTFLFLDEFQSLGYIEGLTTLLRTGPGLGVTSVLGVHDLGLLKETYGQHAEGVLSMCGHFAVLRTNSRETAKWGSELFDEQVIRVRRRSATTSPGGNEPSRASVTDSEEDKSRPVVEPGEFLRLPLTDMNAGLTGYFKGPLHPSYRGHLDGNELFPPSAMPSTYTNTPEEYRLHQSDVQEFVRRSEEQLVPRDELPDELPTNEEIQAGDLELMTVKLPKEDGYRHLTLGSAMRVATSMNLHLVEFPVGLSPPNCLVTKAPWMPDTDEIEEDASHTEENIVVPNQAHEALDPDVYDILKVTRVAFASR